MPIEITMPRLSDTMEQGAIVAWHVKEGDAVSSGDVIADIETDKATMELQAFDDGTVAKLAVKEGENVAVGTVIAVLAQAGEDPEAAASTTGRAATSSGKAAEGEGREQRAASEAPAAVAEAKAAPAKRADESGAPSNGVRATDDRIFASPLARRIADERGIDLRSIRGSGPAGRIVKKDVESAASGKPARVEPVAAPSAPAHVPAVLEDRVIRLSNMRATIARRLVESKQTIPHYQVTVTARVDRLLELREQLNEQLEPQGVKLSVNDFIVRACALAMHRHPYVNSSWVEGKDGPAVRLHKNVNVGVAIALPSERGGGLVVGTLRNADAMGLRQISAETRRLAKKAREKGLSIEEMADSTFTISNLGMFGVDHFTAIINPPNVAILAVGRAMEKPFIETDDEGEPSIVVGHEMSMTMSSDHRVVDGAMAAEYLNSVREYLEKPATLLV